MIKVYMGQIMSECDCTHHGCETRGYCMAERIDQLVATNGELVIKLDEVERRRARWMYKSDVAEAKLAKALDGLRFADDGANHGAMTPTYSEHALRYILRGIRDRARAVLEELGEDT